MEQQQRQLRAAGKEPQLQAEETGRHMTAHLQRHDSRA